jgi:cell division transport system permease protein
MTTLLLGVFIPVIKASSTTTQNVQSQLALYVYMYPDATKKQAQAAEKRINKIRRVKNTDFVSPNEGLKRLRENIGKSEIGQGITQLQGKNPLPYAVVVHPNDPNDLPAIQREIMPPGKHAKPISPAIQEVNSGQKAAQAIRTVTNAVKVMLTVIAALLLIVSLLLIANTIRLSIYARRREVEVMRLVGATNWFIRWPFVIEGLIVGLTGAAIAVGMLWIGKVTIIDPLAENFALIDNFSTVGFVPLIIVLLAASIVVSALGCGITLRRFLRV